MRSFSRRSMFATLALVAVVGCAPAPAAPPKAAPTQPPAAQAAKPAAETAKPKVDTAKPQAAASEQEWERTLEAARKEGSVVVAGYPLQEAQEAATKPFEAKYGIQVTYEGLGGPRGPALVERVRQERAAGQYLWDVFIGGTSTIITSLKPIQALDPLETALILPEVKDPKNWRRGLEFTDSEKMGVVFTPRTAEGFWINPTMVSPDQFTSYKDLLDPKWKGKIEAHDPRIAGSGNAVFSFFLAHKDLGPDFIRGIAAHDLTLLRDVRQELDLLAQGKYTVCLGCSPAEARGMIEKGIPVQAIDPRKLKERGYISSAAGNVSLFNRAPHPNAAKVYLNWLLGKDGQTGYARALTDPSARLDVSNDWSKPHELAEEGFWPSHSEQAVLETRSKLPPILSELFGA